MDSPVLLDTLSIISAWEVGMLGATGRLRFSISCEQWINRAFGLPGLSLVPLTPSICVRSAWLLTRDERILQYGRAGHVRSSAL